MKILNIICSLAAAALLAACGEQGESPVVAAEMPFTVSMRSASAPGVERDPAASEKIGSWWVAFVDASGNVAEVVSRPDYLTVEVESEIFKAVLAPGTYTAYAFANITQSELGEAAGLAFVKGAKMRGNPAEAVFSGFDAGKLERMPMSGFLHVSVDADGKPGARDIEVVRMFGKVELEFTNGSSDDLIVESWSFGPLYAPTAAVPLLPDYATLGKAPNPSDGGATQFRSKTDPITLPAGRSATDAFYTREIISAHPTSSFVLTVNTSADGVESARHSLAYELNYINRNDWVRIPVTLTDWVVDMDVRFYPPIGGYPAVVVSQDNDEFYATFGTPGRFVITPRARKSPQGALEPLEIETVSTEGDAIFIPGCEPAIDAVTGEMIGEMSSATGSAVTTVTFRVKADANVSHLFTRKFHIIRK